LDFEKIIEKLTHEYTGRLINVLESKSSYDRRSYGFEYEFLPEIALDLNYMKKLYEFLPHCGFILQKDSFLHPTGTRITFEPGGQIEYQSIPLFPEDMGIFSSILELIRDTNERIFKELDILYIATGFIPDRGGAPLCLEADRYKNLHARMPQVGSRGLEMMKGTASIHLHVVIMNISELVLFFTRLCEVSSSDDFRMQAERRDILNNTDPSRCGFDCGSIRRDFLPQQLISALVRFTLKAEDILTSKPFYATENTDFDSFMYHLTTIFTDVRLNIKGPTLELRTLDSLPIPAFEVKWRKFIEIMEDVR